MKSLEIIEMMSNANGPSGFEGQVVQSAKRALDDQLTVKTDMMNNCTITMPAYDENKPLIMLDGHSDEVGLMVQSITSAGLLRVIAIGGWDIKNLISQKMRLMLDDNKIIKGVVLSVPVHFLSADARNKMPEIQDVLVDVGAKSRQEVLNLGIKLGTPMVPDTVFEHQLANDVIIGKAFDNRLGCSLVIDTMNRCLKENYHQVTGTISTQEEVGLRGAKVVGNITKADLAIVFEGTPADDTFVFDGEAQSIIGGGVQIRLADNSMIANPRFAKKVLEIAEKMGVNYQVAVRRGGGTNGGAYHLAQKGIPSVVLGVPTRYIHSHYGIAKLQDYYATRDLAMAIIDYVAQNGIDF